MGFCAEMCSMTNSVCRTFSTFCRSDRPVTAGAPPGGLRLQSAGQQSTGSKGQTNENIAYCTFCLFFTLKSLFLFGEWEGGMWVLSAATIRFGELFVVPNVMEFLVKKYHFILSQPAGLTLIEVQI